MDYYRPWGWINPVACPIRSRIKINTDSPIRHVSDLSILSDLPSSLIKKKSAWPRLNTTTSNNVTIIILNITILSRH